MLELAQLDRQERLPLDQAVTLDELVTMVSYAERLAIFFARCNAPVLRDRLIAEASRLLAGKGFRVLASYQLEAGEYRDGIATASLFEWVQGVYFPPPLDLPPAATAFIGREAEIDALARLLLARDSRLLTLDGPGGIGRTAWLSRRRALAQRLPGRFLNDVRFVPLAALKCAQSLSTHVASALGVELQGAAPPRQQLLSYLEARELLLILDNFEHLLDDQGEAVAFLVDLLRLAPNVKLLLTSRERLSLYEEVILDVPGLDAPDEGEDEATMASDAQLFVEAGCRVRRNYAPGAGELRWIARACRLVEGTPLAIELAASWLRHYDCAEIVRQIEHSLDFLASNYRDLPERQRSLRSVFEYSWQLLTVEEQTALAQLGVFSGGFSPDAADAVAGPSAPLADLADKSLVQRQRGGRCDLHPLLRMYAAEKLALDPAAQGRATDNHAAFYLDYLGAQGSGESPEQRAAIRQELANIRCAWEWSAHQSVWDALGRAAATLHSFYSVQSWFQEGIDLFAQTLAMLELAGDAGPALAALRVELLGRKARMHIHIGGLVMARADLDRAWADLGQVEGPARGSVLDSLAITHYYAGDYGQAAALARDSLQLSEQAANQEGISFALNFLGSCAKAQGDYEEARSCFQRAAELALVRNDEIGAAMVFNNLGNLLQSVGDWEGAQRYYHQSGQLFKAHDHVHGAATTLANAGRLACKQGWHAKARNLLSESLALKRKIGDTRGEAVALAGLGDVALATGAYAEARTVLRQALELAHQSGDRKQVLEIVVAFAELFTREEQRPVAVRLLDFTLNHPGIAQEARQQAETLARKLDFDWAAAPVQAQDAPFKDEASLFSFLRALD